MISPICLQIRSYIPTYLSRSIRRHITSTMLKPLIKFYIRTPLNFFSSNKSKSFSNPYKVLGISKTASTNEIKKKFRELAKKFHPDINPTPEAKNKMAEITSAYELLCDPKKRSFFDTTGYLPDDPAAASAWSQQQSGINGFNSRMWSFTDFTDILGNMADNSTDNIHFSSVFGTKQFRGDNIYIDLPINLMESINGVSKTIDLKAKCNCKNCNGSGSDHGKLVSTCKNCNGTGTKDFERGSFVFKIHCQECNGYGNIITHPCKECDGTGVQFQTKKVQIDIPKGIRHGMELRILNQGHAGNRGGKSGNLFITILIRAHPKFKWIGDDIHVDVPLTIKQCLLGDEVKVPSLDNLGYIKMSILPGTKPGTQKILKTKGPPKINGVGYGDLIINFKLVLPNLPLSQRQIEIIQEFEALSCKRDNVNNQADKTVLQNTKA
ncbi:DnaJ domain-containing protein [Cryptosporidium muris RN66]|uniref:DnaJ domain-containing protein n=1 Tax=Cryptosporidium muris (strain RN66) TaxID=441375 RepID=B6ADW7_CRYMR|nr:DnaJ domain-containing protein [Cryptosporidium muris RN66]EEA06408.1 DnaJ domain-containing protein [Cryptosporidium muris RN66]|eukprot:XP_002140757.1 DnaJ domain-containing protein [Cryptosporidium muris RN66]